MRSIINEAENCSVNPRAHNAATTKKKIFFGNFSNNYHTFPTLYLVTTFPSCIRNSDLVNNSSEITRNLGLPFHLVHYPGSIFYAERLEETSAAYEKFIKLNGFYVEKLKKVYSKFQLALNCHWKLFIMSSFYYQVILILWISLVTTIKGVNFFLQFISWLFILFYDKRTMSYIRFYPSPPFTFHG